MTVRLYETKDYPTIAGWWNGHGERAIPDRLLNAMGCVVEDDDGTPRCAAWLQLQAGSERMPAFITVFSWPVTNPENTPRQSFEALRVAVDFQSMQAKTMGYGLMMAWTANTGLGKLYRRMNFAVGEENATVYYLTLAEENAA